MTTCRSDDWVCEALERLGIEGFAARTIEWLLSQPFKIVLILVLTLVVSRMGARLARHSVESFGTRSPFGERTARAAQRSVTLGAVVASAVRIVVWTFGTLAVLDEVGLNLAPLLAGASIVGVAVGFGAQSLVKDFLSGFFILVEDQYGLGDSITIADVTGTVEEVNLRLTQLRAADGTVWFVPNGEIRKVGNAAKGWATAIVDVVVGPDVDLDAAIAAIEDELGAMAAEPDWQGVLTEKPEVVGLEISAADSLTLRVSARTSPDDRTRVARAIRRRVISRLYRERRRTGS